MVCGHLCEVATLGIISKLALLCTVLYRVVQSHMAHWKVPSIAELYRTVQLEF